MSFVQRHIYISDNHPPKQPVHQFKHCSKCDEERAPEGGVDMGNGKWLCANCWTIRATRSKKRD